MDLRAMVGGPGGPDDVPRSHDGYGTYALRFLALQVGTHSSRTSSNARPLDGIAGLFAAAPPEARSHPFSDACHIARDFRREPIVKDDGKRITDDT